MSKANIVIVATLALALGFAVALTVRESQAIKLEAGTWFGEQSRTLPDFELIDQNGEVLSKVDFAGKWHLMFFGYTHCPDICPASLQTMAQIVDQIDDPSVRDRLKIVFVSVDPERDTPQLMKSYVEYFNPAFIGASAQENELERLTSSLGIAYFLDKAKPEQKNYEVSHSSAFVLIDPDVRYAGIFSAPQHSGKIARDLVEIIQRH